MNIRPAKTPAFKAVAENNAETSEPEGRAATEEDFKGRFFYDLGTGLFSDVDSDTRRRLLPHTRVVEFRERQIVFTEGQPVAGKLWVILSGAFEVRRFVLDETHTICLDRPGIILSDVELLLHDIEETVYRRGKKNCNFSTVVCVHAGTALEISPASALWETQSFELARNLGRQVAIKLMRRNADSDLRFLGKKRQIAAALVTIITVEYKDGMNRKTPGEMKGQASPRLPLREWELTGIRHAHLAKRLLVSAPTIHSFDKSVRAIDKGFYWRHGTIEMSSAFYDKIRAGSLQEAVDYLCPKPPGEDSVQSC